MSKKILIVDDNEFIVEIMTYILANKGYEVIALSEGENVLKLISTDNPDLVILDVTLPDADGRDLCKAIKNNIYTENLPVIICSGRNDLNSSLRQQGAPNDVLSKPFNVDALVDMVAYQLAA
jgi:DNA-binding response OmpR family regulator